MPGTKGTSHPSDPKSLFQKLSQFGRKLSSKASPDDVHQLRTTSRRIETIIMSHQDQLSGTAKLIKQLGRLRRKAGKVRDFDVQMDALRAITVESITRDKARLTTELERVRGKREKKLLATVAKEFDNTLQKRIGKVETQLATVSTQNRPDYAALALDKFADIANEYTVLNEDNLHPFRIACKRVRYLAELGDTREASTIVVECRRAQDAIGTWHDAVMLTQRAERLFSKNRSPLVAVLYTTQSAKLTDAFRIAAEVKKKLQQFRASMRPGPHLEPVPQSQMRAVAS